MQVKGMIMQMQFTKLEVEMLLRAVEMLDEKYYDLLREAHEHKNKSHIEMYEDRKEHTESLVKRFQSAAKRMHKTIL